ncbi:MBL fold hydrolase [Streptomyces umbrinus]|uniref:MBL fold metallo-hydrolase n=1 Tax=Streptomyces umbrinus TaxID=67370 RepID=UPI0016753DE6|nr:MBL fold metallo-hydrolase [Streptomyces umbrinus]GHB23775.1 MBL fold hydrolase [Streptomyces umbrinus]
MRVTWEEAGWEELGPRVGRCRLPVWDCTVGLVVGEGAALMIDAGSGLREGARLRTEAQRLLGGGRVTHLALTHPHFDHVFGAAAFAGVEVFGAVGLERVLADGRDELRADAVRNGADPDEAAEAADLLVRPRHPVSGEWTLDLGGGVQVLLANVGPGHTGHDLAVLVPGSPGAPGGPEDPRTGSPEIVFCGDLVEESGEPQAGPDAVPTRWPAALDRLLALGGEDAVYVPGHGAAVDAGFVRAQRDALARRFGVS